MSYVDWMKTSPGQIVLRCSQRDIYVAFVLHNRLAQMYSITKRFADITFEHNAWMTIGGKTVRESEPWYELAGSSWNLAAVTSNIAQTKLFENSEDDSSIKSACSGFQLAAGILSYLQQKSKYVTKDKDLDSQNLKFNITLMLQQAQEVIVVKSLRDGKKSSTTAKLSWMCSDYCETLGNSLTFRKRF